MDTKILNIIIIDALNAIFRWQLSLFLVQRKERLAFLLSNPHMAGFSKSGCVHWVKLTQGPTVFGHKVSWT